MDIPVSFWISMMMRACIILVDHLWEDLLEDGGECLRLCNSLDIILPNGVIRPSDDRAAKDPRTSPQSSPATILRLSWRGNAYNLTVPWNWREILLLQHLKSLKFDCRLSIDDSADILRQCPMLTDFQFVLGAVSSTVVTHNFLHPTLRPLAISSSVDLRPFFNLERQILGYRIFWENIQRSDFHCHLAEEEIQEICAICHRQFILHQYIHPPDSSSL